MLSGLPSPTLLLSVLTAFAHASLGTDLMLSKAFAVFHDAAGIAASAPILLAYVKKGLTDELNWRHTFGEGLWIFRNYLVNRFGAMHIIFQIFALFTAAVLSQVGITLLQSSPLEKQAQYIFRQAVRRQLHPTFGSVAYCSGRLNYEDSPFRAALSAESPVRPTWALGWLVGDSSRRVLEAAGSYRLGVDFLSFFCSASSSGVPPFGERWQLGTEADFGGASSDLIPNIFY